MFWARGKKGQFSFFSLVVFLNSPKPKYLNVIECILNLPSHDDNEMWWVIDRNGTSARWDGKILNTVSTPLTPCSTGLADTESNDAISVLGGCDEIDAEQLCPHVMQGEDRGSLGRVLSVQLRRLRSRRSSFAADLCSHHLCLVKKPHNIKD